METNAVDYTNLIPLIKQFRQDWVIEWGDVTKLHPTVIEDEKPRDAKVEAYIKLMKEGVIFPPIVVDHDYLILDGWHRWLAITALKKNKTPLLKMVGGGSSKILKDDCFSSGIWTIPYKHIDPLDPSNCLICNIPLIWARAGTLPGPYNVFPRGMPAPPYFYCTKCGLIVDPIKFIVWKSA